MFYTFAALDDLRLLLGLRADETSDDRRLLDLLTAASTGIEQLTGRRFLPRRAVFTLDAPRAGAPLLLPDDLLQLISLSDARGEIPLDDLTLNADQPPYYAIESASGWQWQNSRRDALTITGIWGWHPDWPRAWIGSNDEVRDDLLTGASGSVTVVDVAAADVMARTPRFQVGQIVRIGEEYLQVTGRDEDTHTLQVLRGVLGTTNTVHALYSAISVYLPPPAVMQAALIWASALYRGHESPPPDALALILPLRRPHSFP